MEKTIKTELSATTSGECLWSNQPGRVVEIYKLEVDFDEFDGYGELRAYFHSDTWRVNRHGLIYTDKQWIKEFRQELRTFGFSRRAADDVHYSEQGMQGRNYVSMDIGEAFIKSFNKLYKLYNG